MLGSLGVSLAGCAAHQAVLPSTDFKSEPLSQGEPLQERESGLRVGTLREVGTLPANAAWNTAGKSDAFQRVEGKDTKTVIRTLQQDQDGNVRLTVRDEATEALILDTILVRDDDGQIGIRSTDSNGIASVFQPPALFLPPELKPGDLIEEAFQVDSKGARIPDGSGNGTVQLRGLGLQRIETGRGIVDAFVIESVMSFGIGPAQIVLEQRAWFDPVPSGKGLVAEEGKDMVRVFGIGFYAETRASRILKDTPSD